MFKKYNYNADDMTQLLLQSGHVDKEFCPGQSTLTLDSAVKENKLRNVDNLLTSNSNLSTSALACVMWYPIFKKYNDIVEILIKKGADVNQRGLRDHRHDPRISLLSWAAYFKNERAARLLVANGANVNDWDLLGVGAMYFAVVAKDLSTVNLLLQFGANVNCKDDDENSMLHLATMSDNYKLVKAIGERMSDVNVTNQFGQNALHYAIQNMNSSVAVIKELINLRVSINDLDIVGETPLFYSICLRKYKISETLLTHGAIVNVMSKNNVFPLYLSVASRGQIEVTKLILSRGALVNEQNYDGETGLHIACRKKMVDYIKILLEHGADVNIFDKKRNLPLSYLKKENSEAAQVMLQHIAKLKYLNLHVHVGNVKIIHSNATFKAIFEKYFNVF